MHCTYNGYHPCIIAYGSQHAFTMVHFGAAFLCFVVIYAVCLKLVDAVVGPGFLNSIVSAVCIGAAVYLSVIGADLWLDHGFRMSEITAATADARQDIGGLPFWH